MIITMMLLIMVIISSCQGERPPAPSHIMQNIGLDEVQAGFKIAGRNSNNLRYANDTILMAESEEELKSLLIKVKEESEKVGLKLIFKKLRSWHPVPLLYGK